MRRAEKERLKEGEAADEEMKKLKKDAKKKGASSKESTAKGLKKKAAAGGSDEDNSTSPTHSLNGDNAAADDDDDVEWQTDTSLAAAKQRIAEQLSAATAEMVMLSTEESEKKKQPAPKEATANGSVKTESNTKLTPYDEMIQDIKASLGSGATPSQLKSVLSSSTLPPQDKMNALFETLFDGVSKGFTKEVMKNKKYLAAAVPDEESQSLLVQAIEEFGGKCSAEALKEVPVVLKALYDGDILEEESIVQWYNAAVAAGRNTQVVKNAKPFVEWLQSAESEEDE
jgi:translation initiation factor 5